MRTVLIVDDHDSFRAWARRALSDDGFVVVGEAADGAAAIAAVDLLSPDVMLLDIVLPDMTGFDVAARVGARTVVVLTSSRDLADFGAGAAESAAGFLPKFEVSGAALEEVVRDRVR